MLRLHAIAFVLIVVTFTVHAVGSTSWIQYLIRHYADHDGDWRKGSTAWCLISTGVVLMTLHMIEVLTWATALLMLPGNPQLNTFEEAAYFSFVTFTTLGYGDITLGSQWRLLSGIEAMNGILLAGWSTALLFTVVRRSWKRSRTPKR
jgi:hypothetical protein